MENVILVFSKKDLEQLQMILLTDSAVLEKMIEQAPEPWPAKEAEMFPIARDMYKNFLSTVNAALKNFMQNG